MKKVILLLVFALFSILAYSQDKMITLSGSYVFANVEDSDAQGTAFRINGLYEYDPGGRKWAYGFSVGYTGMNAEGTESLQETKYDFSTWPL